MRQQEIDQALNERLELIRDSAAAVVPADGNLARIRQQRFGLADHDPAVWQQMVELGWPAMLISESDGGIGFGMAELCALVDVLGRGLVPEPLAAVAIAAPLLPSAEREAAMAGTHLCLPVWECAPNGASETGSQYAAGVIGARHADSFLLLDASPARLVAASDAAVSEVRTQDGGTIGTVEFSADAALDAGPDSALARERLALATAAYLAGLTQRAFELTLDLLRTREQFGKPVGVFQALQHRCADHLVQIELMRATIQAAALAMDAGGEPATISRAVSRAKARASDVAMSVTRDAIQLHGGIGYADESDIGLYLRKAMTLVNQAGSAGWHRRRYAELTL